MVKKNKKHKLSIIPTAYEETSKIFEKKKISSDIYQKIDSLEEQRRRKDEEAILEIINEHSKGKNPLVKLTEIRNNTFQEALGSLLSIRNTEAFETMMLLFEYMEKKKSYKIEKLTGTELLKFGKAKSINQEKRHRKLNLLVKQSAIKIQVLDPEESVKNYQNKKSNKGLVYKFYDLLKIDKITYSKTNSDLIVKLDGIQLLPEYIDHIHLVSRRYLPLESIRKIPEERGMGKSRHFLYKLCFKFASSRKLEVNLYLDECMNLGKFYNKEERNLQKKWKPIEKALMEGKKVDLIDYIWVFKHKNEIPEKDRNNFEFNLLEEISNPKYKKTGQLEDRYYKYIESVRIRRLYDLDSSIKLPFNIEDKEPKKEKVGIKLEI